MTYEIVHREVQPGLYVGKQISPSERATLFLIHGYGEYSGRYQHFFDHLSEKGISTYTFDLRGHGRSEGLRAYAPSKEAMMKDISYVRKHFKLTEDTFLFGHSMGGLLAVIHAIENQNSWKGLITSAAALAVDKDMSPILQMLAPIISAIFPKLKTTPLDITYLTRSESNRSAYVSDPLVYREGMRARTGALTLSMIKEAQSRAAEVSIPFLALHGSADRVTMPEGTTKVYNKSSAGDKNIKIYEGLYHELVNEPEKDMIMKDISAWIVERR